MFLLPSLLTMSRYLDDILFIFPPQNTTTLGPLALKHSNGGPYPDSIGIKSEQHGKKVSFLDTWISWRRPRWDKKQNSMQCITLTWSLYEKRKDMKFSNLQMRRGIHHSTALSTHLQMSSILSEGARISRKSLRLRNFLCSFGDFMIDFISQHSTDAHRQLLLYRFHRATSSAAGEHFNKWRLSGSQLWTKLTEKVYRRIPNRQLEPGSKNLILSILDSSYRHSKRERSDLQPSNTIPATNTRMTINDLPPNTLRHTAVPDTPTDHPNEEFLKRLLSNPLIPDRIPDTPTLGPNNVPWNQQSTISQLQTAIPDIAVKQSNIDAACEDEDLDSKLAELPSIAPTP